MSPSFPSPYGGLFHFVPAVQTLLKGGTFFLEFFKVIV